MGALLIGFVAGAAAEHAVSPNMELFWKTGVCGGFTTFSTFSMETLHLLEGGRMAAGLLYAGLSVVLCVAGVYVGNLLAHMLLRRGG